MTATERIKEAKADPILRYTWVIAVCAIGVLLIIGGSFRGRS